MYVKTDFNDDPRIFMIIGGAFNGTTKISMQLAMKYDAVLISRAQVRQILKLNHGKPVSRKAVNKVLLQLIMKVVGTNRNIVIDGNFTTAKQRESILKVLNSLSTLEDMFNNQKVKQEYKETINYINILNYSIIGVYVKPNYKLAFKKNIKCNFPIHIYDLESQYANFEKPYKDEGFKKIIKRRAR
mgnify:CR=1 FL=1